MGSCNTKNDLTIHKYYVNEIEKIKEDIKIQETEIDLKKVNIQNIFNKEYNSNKKIKYS